MANKRQSGQASLLTRVSTFPIAHKKMPSPSDVSSNPSHYHRSGMGCQEIIPLFLLSKTDLDLKPRTEKSVFNSMMHNVLRKLRRTDDG